MKYAHHALELYEAPRDQILAATREFLSNAGFDVGLSSPSDPSIRAERGSHIGFTDQQTARKGMTQDATGAAEVQPGPQRLPERRLEFAQAYNGHQDHGHPEHT